MQLAPLTFKSIRARAVVLKLKRPVVARIATITNIRNTSSLHWRGWLKPENRCLVPANSFAE
jgi:putative SOS response-associated peptidase YedK